MYSTLCFFSKFARSIICSNVQAITSNMNYHGTSAFIQQITVHFLKCMEPQHLIGIYTTDANIGIVDVCWNNKIPSPSNKWLENECSSVILKLQHSFCRLYLQVVGFAYIILHHRWWVLYKGVVMQQLTSDFFLPSAQKLRNVGMFKFHQMPRIKLGHVSLHDSCNRSASALIMQKAQYVCNF